MLVSRRYARSRRRLPTILSRPRRDAWSFRWVLRCSVRSLMRAVKMAIWTSGLPVSWPLAPCCCDDALLVVFRDHGRSSADLRYGRRPSPRSIGGGADSLMSALESVAPKGIEGAPRSASAVSSPAPSRHLGPTASVPRRAQRAGVIPGPPGPLGRRDRAGRRAPRRRRTAARRGAAPPRRRPASGRTGRASRSNRWTSIGPGAVGLEGGAPAHVHHARRLGPSARRARTA